MEENGVDGIIIDLPFIPGEELETVLRRQKVSILIDQPFVAGATGVVRIDLYAAMTQAVEHLVRAGCCQLGCLSAIDHHYTFTERLRGVRDATARLGIPISPQWFCDSNGTIEASFRVAHALLLQNPEIDGLNCFNDVVAAHLTRAM